MGTNVRSARIAEPQQTEPRDMIELKKPYIYTDAPHQLNWDEDQQPERTINRLRADYGPVQPHKSKYLSNKELKAAEVSKNLQLAALYAAPLVEYVTELVAQHAPDAIIDTNELLKGFESCMRKLDDERTLGDPRNIGDYLRIRIVVRGDDPVKAIGQIEDLREAMVYDPRVTSHKDQFRRPCPEGGHRKFAAHRAYGEGANELKAEIQICHEAMETGPTNEAVKALRAGERSLEPSIKTMKALSLSEHWAAMLKHAHEFLQGMRRSLNDEQARQSYLNVLLDSDLRAKYAFPAAAAVGLKATVAQNGFQVVESALRKAADSLPESSGSRRGMLTLIQAHGGPETQRALH